ncbi:NUDIX hydrolase domain-like protein [Microdochium bolleyi]|uniref:NUDIX hydrolase domain-like protein n=1 Tax=Microdochium bolleyi TaxID=196109 RepID=A0A136J945_9PEZI|nr:NUDIX hydrolase domain-like protein [Microdochium bolleyi]
MASAEAKVLSTEPLAPDEAKWTKLVKITYADQTGAQRTWESAERTTRPVSCGIDGVGIVAILRYPSSSSSTSATPATTNGTTTSHSGKAKEEPQIVLQKQYRPPIDAICIEVPAGLVDEHETPEQAALRELREETGYVGTLLSCSPSPSSPRSGSSRSSAMTSAATPTMFNDPGFCNTNLQMVHVDVDMSLPENQDPQPQLEDGEFIETFTVNLGDLYRECVRWEKEGYAIDARVGTLAEGIELARSFGLS